jgi:hypothetical protein
MVSGSGHWLVEDEYEKWVNGVCDRGTEHSPNHRGTRLHSPTHRWRMMLYANVEVIHHGAEVCLLRNLYLHTGT